MMNIHEVRTSQDRVQKLLEEVVADQRQMEAFLVWLSEANARADELVDYYTGQGQVDTEVVLDDPEAVTPPVANEDAALEAMAAHEDGLLRLLRIVTRELTSGLDHVDDEDEDDSEEE